MNRYFSVGVKLYNSEQYKQAISHLENACDLFSDPLIASMKSLKEFSSKLSKRFAVLAYCYQMSGQVEVL
jgi:hypothetical protein